MIEIEQLHLSLQLACTREEADGIVRTFMCSPAARTLSWEGREYVLQACGRLMR